MISYWTYLDYISCKCKSRGDIGSQNALKGTICVVIIVTQGASVVQNNVHSEQLLREKLYSFQITSLCLLAKCNLCQYDSDLDF